MRILLVRDRDFFIYVHQMAQVLVDAGHEVEVLYTHSEPVEELYRSLIEETAKNLGVSCHVVRDRSGVFRRLVSRLLFKFGFIAKRMIISKSKIKQARRELRRAGQFDLVITFDPPALYLVSQISPGIISRTLHYSLEVIEESHPDFHASRITQGFRMFERMTIPSVKALIIQDKFRCDVLLARIGNADRIKRIYFPVAMSGGRHMVRESASSRYFPELPPGNKVILFFGGLWSDVLLSNLEKESRSLPRGQTLVVWGGRGTAGRHLKSHDNFLIKRDPLPFSEINDMISSADVALALYADRDNNSKYTAFSSEKIARYTQCGIPFIAFANSDYACLRESFRCCELIDDYSEMNEAIKTILSNKEIYKKEALSAFDKFYSLQNTKTGLMEFLANHEAGIVALEGRDSGGQND